jgi:hypothetical protein
VNYLVHATLIHPSICLQYLILLFTIDTVTVFILLLLLLFHYCHYYKTVATDKLLRASLFPGAAELTTHLSRLINILWLPLYRINKFGFYFPRRLLRSPILVGHHLALGLLVWVIDILVHSICIVSGFKCSGVINMDLTSLMWNSISVCVWN